jgi:predicted MPP superfamily phosphohydrolase
MYSRVLTMTTRLLLKPFRIQYISDIHLEFYDKLAFPLILKPNARYLALCGDIGYPNRPIFNSFIDYCSRHWDKVFYIPGNHEYYNKRRHDRWKYNVKAVATMETIEDHIKTVLFPYKNVFYLNKEIHELPEDNVNVIGATLWTHIPKELVAHASGTLNDFSQIACKIDETPYYEQFSPAKMNELHADHSKFLLGALDVTATQGRKAVVLTHHLPSKALVMPRYAADPSNYLFYTEATKHLEHSALAAWICGHSHAAQRILYRPGVWLTLNCRGYPREKVEGFSEGAYLEVCGQSSTRSSCNNASKDEEIEFM